jgi:hypothetical protein
MSGVCHLYILHFKLSYMCLLIQVSLYRLTHGAERVDLLNYRQQETALLQFTRIVSVQVNICVISAGNRTRVLFDRP